jgi:hypothetical protein
MGPGAPENRTEEQEPDRQTSPEVHRLPSSHDVRSGALGFEQIPVAGSHVPAA